MVKIKNEMEPFKMRRASNFRIPKSTRRKKNLTRKRKFKNRRNYVKNCKSKKRLQELRGSTKKQHPIAVKNALERFKHQRQSDLNLGETIMEKPNGESEESDILTDESGHFGMNIQNSSDSSLNSSYEDLEKAYYKPDGVLPEALNPGLEDTIYQSGTILPPPPRYWPVVPEAQPHAVPAFGTLPPPPRYWPVVPEAQPHAVPVVRHPDFNSDEDNDLDDDALYENAKNQVPAGACAAPAPVPESAINRVEAQYNEDFAVPSFPLPDGSLEDRQRYHDSWTLRPPPPDRSGVYYKLGMNMDRIKAMGMGVAGQGFNAVAAHGANVASQGANVVAQGANVAAQGANVAANVAANQGLKGVGDLSRFLGLSKCAKTPNSRPGGSKRKTRTRRKKTRAQRKIKNKTRAKRKIKNKTRAQRKRR